MNPTPPKYKIPAIRNSRSGLMFSRGMWKMMYEEDGVKKQKSTGCKVLEEATKVRDEFFASLGVPIKKIPGDRHIYHVEYWNVTVRGVNLGNFRSLAQAKDARKAAYKEMGLDKPTKPKKKRVRKAK